MNTYLDTEMNTYLDTEMNTGFCTEMNTQLDTIKSHINNIIAFKEFIDLN